MMRDSIGAHFRAAFTVALVLAAVQVAVETLAIGAVMRSFLLAPAFFEGRMYDFCVKLVLWMPGGDAWLRGGILDHFRTDGFGAKLAIALGLLGPNVAVLGLLASAVATGRYGLGKAARPLPVLAVLLVIGLLVHAVAVGLGLALPKGWRVMVLLRNAARVLVWERAGVALAVWAAAGLGALLLLRLQPRARRAAALAGATAATLVALASGAPPGSAGAARPAPDRARHAGAVDNVVLISIDSLRADRVGCYGNPRPTSPTLDRLARDGARFADAVATAPWTLPSHMSILTGRDALAHGVIADTDLLPREVPTLAEQLQRAGLATGAVVSAFYVKGQYGFQRGFDHYDDWTIPTQSREEDRDVEPAPAVTDAALRWLGERKDQRFFLFVHYYDVHYDYIPPPPYNTMFDPDYRGSVTAVNFIEDDAINRRMPARDLEHILALYDGEIRWVDDHIARLLHALEESGAAPRTAVIVTSDHGDEFFEHGDKGHKRTLYREIIQVPLVMRVPGMAAGQVIETPVSLVDLAPTILDLLAVPAPPGLSGQSLVPALAGARLSERDGLYAWFCWREKANCKTMQHATAGTLIHTFQPARLEYYAAADRAQRQNLVRRGAWPRERLTTLAERLDAQWALYRQGSGTQDSLSIDPATREHLRQLGYGD